MDNSTYQRARLFAGLSALGWIGMFGLTGAGLNYLGDLSGVVYHLALLPLVFVLVTPEWSRAAGYIWIFCDTALNVASINGLDADMVWALRLGAHIAAAIWIISASRTLRPAAKVTGLLLGASLAVHAVTAPVVGEVALGVTAFPLMVIWLTIVAAGRAVQSDDLAPEASQVVGAEPRA